MTKAEQSMTRGNTSAASTVVLPLLLEPAFEKTLENIVHEFGYLRLEYDPDGDSDGYKYGNLHEFHSITPSADDIHQVNDKSIHVNILSMSASAEMPVRWKQSPPKAGAAAEESSALFRLYLPLPSPY